MRDGKWSVRNGIRVREARNDEWQTQGLALRRYAMGCCVLPMGVLSLVGSWAGTLGTRFELYTVQTQGIPRQERARRRFKAVDRRWVG